MDFKNLKNFMDFMAEKRSPGNAIEVYVDGKQAFKYQSGVSDIETKKTLTGDEYYYIYSCSKVTTVTAGLQLLEQGKFLISDPLYDYIPEYKEMYVKDSNGEIKKAQKPITIGNLFSMTSGLTYNFNTDGFKKARELTNGKMDTDTVIRSIASDPIAFEPGEKWQYGLSHDVLAGLISIITGKKFRDYVKENIFEPLGMNNSMYHPTPDVLSKMASQYTFVPDGQTSDLDLVEAQKYGKAESGKFENAGKVNSHILGEEYDSGGAGVITTVSDYVKIAAALANYGIGLNGEKILSKGSVELMKTDALTDAQRVYLNWGQLSGYSYGFGVRTLMSKAVGGSIGPVGEFGWGGAAGATILCDTENKLAYFYAQHTLNPREEFYQPRLRNVVYSALK